MSASARPIRRKAGASSSPPLPRAGPRRPTTASPWPAAVFPSRWLALLAAAVLPGTGRDPLLRIDPQADADGVNDFSCGQSRSASGPGCLRPQEQSPGLLEQYLGLEAG